MFDEAKKKENRYTPVLTFSLMLDAKNALNPAVEVSKIDPKDFITHMDEYMPDFDYTQDIAGLITHVGNLIDFVLKETEEYCGTITDVSYPSERVSNRIPDIPTLHQTIKKKKLN